VCGEMAEGKDGDYKDNIRGLVMPDIIIILII
jgi:hypothetical protein